MAVTRHFLGWDRPVAALVRDYLLPARLEGPADLEGTLIVVPTRQAGRRLREALARACDAQGTALLSAQVVTPNFLFRSAGGEAEEAPAAVALAAWVAALMAADPAGHRGLFPARVRERDFAWAARNAALIQGLRQDLADGGLRIGDLIRACGAELPEAERWHDLAQLEAQYRERLAALGLQDSCDARVRAAESPALAEGIRRILVVAVPDPALLALRALERLAQRAPVEILVWAPAALAARFDGWGRPLPDAWARSEIDIPDAGENLLPAGPPADQCRAVLDRLSSERERFGPRDVAIGVPDRTLIEPLANALRAQGLTAFDPSDRRLCEHPLYGLLESYAELVLDGSYAAVRTLLRHADFLAYAQADLKVMPRDLLTQLDQFQNDFLPETLEDLARRLRPGASARAAAAFPDLAPVIARLEPWLAAFRDRPVETAVREFLMAVYARRDLDPHDPRDAAFAAAADLVDEGLRQCAPKALGPLGLDRTQTLRLLLLTLRDAAYHPERDEAAVELEGWLELPWNDAPLLMVTGMNEGLVPDSRLGDIFLPDALRARLGLRDNALRFARDAFLLQALIESRRADGRVVLICGRTTAAGDPLKPSRLLFRCPDSALVERTLRLFGPAPDRRVNVPASISFRLQPAPDPGPPEAEAEAVPTALRVTQFRDYLACPFRFYLAHVLGMRSLDDRKAGVDALDFGTMVHAALQAMAASGEWRCADAEALGRFLGREAELWVAERFGPALPVPVSMALDAARQRLAAAARLQAALVRDGWELVAWEQDCSAERNGMKVLGRIDRVDRHSGSGQIRVLDYKTSERRTPPAEIHLRPVREDTPEFACADCQKRKRRWADLQLPLYRLLAGGMAWAGSAAGAPIGVGYFALPKAIGETEVTLWEELDEALEASALRCADRVLDCVRRRIFWPPAERVDYDGFEAAFGVEVARAFEPLAAAEPRAGRGRRGRKA